MFSSKNLKNYLKILRIKRCFCSYRKTMGMDSNMFKEEEVILYDFLSLFNFDETDSIIAEKLIIDDNKDDRCQLHRPKGTVLETKKIEKQSKFSVFISKLLQRNDFGVED